MTRISQGRDNYADMHAGFGWRVPARFNIAQACCGKWARRADATRRVAIRVHGAELRVVPAILVQRRGL